VEKRAPEEAETKVAKIVAGFRALWKALEWLSHQLGWIAGGLTSIMIIAVMREVVGRYFFHRPSDWSLELSGFLLVGLVYLAAPHTELVEGHIRIDFLYDHFKGKVKNVIDIIISLVGICWCVIVMWQGGRIAWYSYLTDARSEEIMMWPLFPSQAMVPVGAFLLCLILLGKIVKNLSFLFKE